MFSVRFHGRGGQGVVTATELLALAAFREGRHAQAFPRFGSERMGAPVQAFCRIDDKPIRTREPVTEPDALIIQDYTLLHLPGTFDGLTQATYVLINSIRRISDLDLAGLADGVPAGRIAVVPASLLAQAELGRPLPGAAMLGAFAALTADAGVIGLESVLAAIAERFTEHPRVADGNAAAACAAFSLVRDELREISGA